MLFRSTKKGAREAQLSLPSKIQLALTKGILELDKVDSATYIEVEHIYKAYLDEKQRVGSMMNTFERFCAGSYVVGETDDGYLIGEARMDDQDNIIFHAPLKRYANAKDYPELASSVAIIKAWASGQPFHEKDSELGLPPADKYYDAVDVASGYRNHDAVWFLIPKAPA